MTKVSRRCFFAAAVAAPWFIAPTFAAETATLAETLKAMLKCRRQVEKDFVDLVVTKVNQGKLSKELVLNTMTYARSKRDDIPFPYFQTAIRLRAAKIGVTL